MGSLWRTKNESIQHQFFYLSQPEIMHRLPLAVKKRIFLWKNKKLTLLWNTLIKDFFTLQSWNKFNNFVQKLNDTHCWNLSTYNSFLYAQGNWITQRIKYDLTCKLQTLLTNMILRDLMTQYECKDVRYCLSFHSQK